MLAAPSTFSFPSYMPQRPSPLSPRSVNERRFPVLPLVFGMSGSENESAHSKGSSIYAKNQFRPTPFSSRTRDEQRDRRRDLFLKRVDQTRDDKRWEGRSEEILRCDHFAHERRWKEVHESQPDPDFNTLVAQHEELEPESPVSYQSLQTQPPFQIYSDPHVEEVDLVAQQEQLELQEWAEFLAQANMATKETPAEEVDDTSQMTDYQDNEYDSLFMDLIDGRPDVEGQKQIHQDTDMDLSA